MRSGQISITYNIMNRATKHIPLSVVIIGADTHDMKAVTETLVREPSA